MFYPVAGEIERIAELHALHFLNRRRRTLAKVGIPAPHARRPRDDGGKHGEVFGGISGDGHVSIPCFYPTGTYASRADCTQQLITV